MTPRWLLVGDVGFDNGYDELPLASCIDVEGIFVDLPPRPREQFTLVACAPTGALADALGNEPGLLGKLYVAAPPPPPDTAPVWWGEDLTDLVVRAHRPNPIVPGTVDIDLDGFVHLDDRTDAVKRSTAVTEFVLMSPDKAPYGVCQDITGLFRDQADPLVPQVRLLGCQLQPKLLRALDSIGQSSKASLRRRKIRADVHLAATNGQIIGAIVAGTIEAAEPSPLGAGLVDITIANGPHDPLPTGVLTILDHWRTGRPTEKNLWAPYSRELRHHWAGLALTHRSNLPDQPPGTTYHLDGRHVINIEGFYCALGEAINGPAGYFGWNLDALNDCLRGRFGAQAPFHLTWHHSTTAREHLLDREDQDYLHPTVAFDYLLDMLTEHQVEIDLR
jgi:RNAse (barnase) inhibitor barstar